MRASPQGVLLLSSALFALLSGTSMVSAASSTTDNAYKGCYEGGALQFQQSGSFGTIDACRDQCRSAGFSVAGSNGDTCYCDNTINSGVANTRSLAECDLPCSSDSSQMCGGTAGYSSVYSDIVSTTAATFRDFTLLGCFDDCNGRVLPDASFNLGDSTRLDTCANSCSGYKYFGLEFGHECWCAGQTNEAGKERPSYECNQPAQGSDLTYTAGGHCRISVYGPAPPTPSTSTTSTSPADTTTSSSSTSASQTSTSSEPTTTSTSSSTTAEATSTSTTTSSEPTPTSTSTSSTTEATSASTTSTATSTSTTSTSTSTSTSTTSTSTSTSTSTTSTPTSTSTSTTSTATSTSTTSSATTTSSTTSTTSTKPLPTLPSTVKKLGCFNQGPLRALLVQAYKNNAANTPLLCSQTCSKFKYRYSGVEGKDCYCDNFALLAFLLGGPGQKGCTTPCPSVPEITCGGKDRIEIAQDTLWKPSFINVVPSKDKH
ncbi:Carbohydrate-binding WSC [Kalmanozyma brasiliensis GHG001]|uniref:Carbohydrate-binding WSC n=1 Tax=Kalmanozyma brasiliensis (strain GHG001) TaxID=1365824 RepID=UPI002867BEC7|nr:Carbohydrate-binding WSC [Kalmanozyma brasiliensis GHG001]KAF6767005.1 Carbohydrate-binding WSC [Kalmanozyma brasiliensis GHG001]